MHERMRGRDPLNFPCLGRATLVAATLAGLAACASPDTAWTRPNTGDAARAEDYRECNGQTRSVAGTALGIDQDIAASRGNDWRRAGTYDSEVERNTGSDAAIASSVLNACMKGKGYRHR